jgi:tetratricopeptide (TPR) repeat protein
MLTFEDIKTEVETRYVRPIANVFRRSRIMGQDDLGGYHKCFIDIFEVLIKFICIVYIQEARKIIPNLKERLPQKEKTLEFLRRPSLGGWISFLRILCNIELGNVKPIWIDKIQNWYHEPKNAVNYEVPLLFDQLEGINYEKRTKTPNAEICNALVSYRNKFLAHAANIRPEELKRRFPLLEKIMAYLLKSLSILGEMILFHTKKIEVAEDNKQWSIQASNLIGVSEEPVTFICQDKLDLSDIYLAESIDEKTKKPPISLGPFLIWHVNEELKRPEIYFYNEAWRTKLEYLSYYSGSYYYHKELHSGFKDLITLKLKPGMEEDTYRFMSPEDRAGQAEKYFKRAILLEEQERLEDAIETLEQSAEYERRPETFLAMAKIQSKLGDPSEAVKQTLQNCLDLEPDNKGAITLYAELETQKEKKQKIPSISDERPDQIKYSTFFHALTPSRFRNHAKIFWFMLLFVWYMFSGIIEYTSGFKEDILSIVTIYIFTIIVVETVITLSSIYKRLYIPLSLQLDSMRLARFQKWFDAKSEAIFGKYVYQGSKFKLMESFKREKFYYLLLILFVLTLSISAFLVTTSQRFPLLLMVTRCVGIVLFIIVAFPGVRFIIASTIFVYDYSRLSLKPMLTKINDDGIRSFGRILTSTIIRVAIAYSTLWISAFILIKMSAYYDFLFLGMTTILCSIWSIGLPLTLSHVARESKIKAVHEYSSHIEQAFKNFLKSPNESSLNKYKWLLNNQQVIRKIPIWPLSFKQSLLVIVSNLFLLAVDALYISLRLDLLQLFSLAEIF